MKVYSRGGVAVHTDYRENIIVDPDHPILVWKANKDRLRPSWFPVTVRKDFPRGLPKIGSQHSEDALTWNVLRTLQLNNRIQMLIDIFAPGLDIYKIYFWGHDADQHSEKMDAEVQDMLNQMEPWGKNGIRQQTEPDVMLRGKCHVIMVECKLGKPGEMVRAWCRSRPGMRSQYKDFMKELDVNLFSDSFDYEEDGNRFYQLFRNYLFGAALSLKWGTDFSLLAIVNSLNSNLEGRNHAEEFSSFQSLLRDPSNTLLITWQDIWGTLPKETNLLSLRTWMANHPLLALSQAESSG